MRLRHGAVAIAAVLLVTVGRASFAEGDVEAPPFMALLSRVCVDEPIFSGLVCVFEANKGAARTVVLVHGINGSVADWSNQISALAARFHVVAIDLPGFGASTRANVLYSVDRYADVLDFVIRRYASGRVSLVGHSLGGAIVLWYAGNHSDRIDRVVVADVPGVLHRLSLAKHHGGGWLEKWVGQPEAPGPSAVGRLLGEVLERFEWLELDPETVLQSEAARQRVLGGDPARISALALAAADFSDVIAKMTVPTLILWGGRDEIATIRTGYVLAARLPSARLVVVPGAHSPMKEHPQPFTEAMMAHLNAADVPGRTAPPEAEPSPENQVGKCEQESHVVFTGHFDELTIRGCSDVTIRDATVSRLDVRESTVVLLKTVIRNDRVGATIVGSEVVATATDITGDIAINVSRSRLDLAGVRLVGTTAAVAAEQGSNVTFSVSWIESPRRRGPVHEYIEVAPGHPL